MCACLNNWRILACQNQLRIGHDRLSWQRHNVQCRKSGSVSVIRHPVSSEAEITALGRAQYRDQSHYPSTHLPLRWIVEFQPIQFANRLC